jgi:hypothetical protein
MAYPCLVCTHPDRQAIDAAIGTGVSDYEVSRKFGIERVSIGRHRRRHLIKPAQDKLAILSKDSSARQERQMLAAAAAADEPSVDVLVQAALGTRALLKKLGSIEERLERMSARAEEGGSSTGVAALAGQQIRGLEFGAKLAGNPNFRPPSAILQASDKAVVSIEMIFNNAGKRETIDLVGKVVDGDLINPSAAEGDLPAPHPNQRIRPDEKVAGSYWSFGKLPDKAVDDDGDQS